MSCRQVAAVLTMETRLLLCLVCLGRLPYGAGDNFTIAYLSPLPPSRETSVAAIDVAIENVTGQGLLTQHHFRVLYKSTRCAPNVGIPEAIGWAEDEELAVLLGPLCSNECMAASYTLRYWNIPIFTNGCTDSELSDKTVFPNLIRLNPGFERLAEAVLEIMAHFEWRRAALWAQDSGQCDFGAEVISDMFRREGLDLAEWIRFPYGHSYGGWYQPMPISEIDDSLRKIRQRARIVFVCAAPADIVNLTLRIQHMGMDNGEYVFISYVMAPLLADGYMPWLAGSDDTITKVEIQRRKEAFYIMKQLALAGVSASSVDGFIQSVQTRLRQDPWNIITYEEPSTIAMFLHDAAYLYLLILAEVLDEGLEPRNYTLFFDRAKNRTFEGVTGRVSLNDFADRNPDFWLMFVGPEVDRMTTFLDIRMVNPPGERFLSRNDTVYWGPTTNHWPPDEPYCGFQGEYCPEENSLEILISIGVVTVCLIFIVITVVLHRRKLLERELALMLWRIKYEDLFFSTETMASKLSLSRHSLATSLLSDGLTHHTPQQDHTASSQRAVYKSTAVVVRRIDLDAVSLARDSLLELKVLREMNHDNLVTFVGVCIDIPNVCIVTEYCPKGSLQDVLENDEIKLDWIFKVSLITDLSNGLSYLHKSSLRSHGHLRSSSCFIDGRWGLKIASHGLHFLKSGDKKKRDLTEAQIFSRRLWTAPELLRMGIGAPPAGTQKGDIYSLAIVMLEILYRAPPYYWDDLAPEDIVGRIMITDGEPFRPRLPTDTVDIEVSVAALMQRCWMEAPYARPHIDDVRKTLRDLNKGRKYNIMDIMVQKLERYATNLEDIVQHRTAELVAEKRKTDLLLYQMLPPSIAEQLKQGKSVKAEIYEAVTIYFSDIVGFTTLSSSSTPIEVVMMLNDLYTLFDDIISLHDVYKVETIGDAYMVVSGLPNRNEGRHAAEIANMALDLLSAVYTNFRVRHRPDVTLKLRIGLHTGSCAAGVVGLKMPRYCLFGDTVNMASRMESNGLPLRIHLSSATYDALSKPGVYQLTERGTMEIKGKGLQMTYWLKGKQNYQKPLPEQSKLED